VALATVGNVSVTLNGDGTSATITGTNVTMTAQGAEYVPLYSEGDQLDNLTATASATGGGEGPTPTEPDGKVTLSKASFNADGDTVTVTGSGFLPTVLGTRPPLSGKPAGVYVVFGRFAADWQPSQGAPSTARKGSPASEGGTKWAVLEEDKATVGGDAAGAITLNPDGTFTATLNVKKDFTGAPDEGRYGIYTYAGSGGVSAAYETFTPITFTTTSTDQQTITAIIPEPEPGGEFSWTIDADDHTVSLGTAENKGAYLQATGQLKPVKVTDTRTNQANAWSVSGQVSDFTGGLSGKYLGWTPKLIEAGTDAVVGSPVASGYVGGAGLSQSSLLGSAPDEHEQGTATLGADLDLRVPVETEPGTYSATLTLTALS
jgi:hypothetical protein